MRSQLTFHLMHNALATNFIDWRAFLSNKPSSMRHYGELSRQQRLPERNSQIPTTAGSLLISTQQLNIVKYATFPPSLALGKVRAVRATLDSAGRRSRVLAMEMHGDTDWFTRSAEDKSDVHGVWLL